MSGEQSMVILLNPDLPFMTISKLPEPLKTCIAACFTTLLSFPLYLELFSSQRCPPKTGDPGCGAHS